MAPAARASNGTSYEPGNLATNGIATFKFGLMGSMAGVELGL